MPKIEETAETDTFTTINHATSIVDVLKLLNQALRTETQSSTGFLDPTVAQIASPVYDAGRFWADSVLRLLEAIINAR